MRLGGEVETGGQLGQQASDGERHARQHGDGVKEIGERANWVSSHWWESLRCWRRLHHDPSTPNVDKYFQRPSFPTPHFFLAMPSSLTPIRDSRDSPGARERETFFAILPLPASQSITNTPAAHRPGITGQPSPASQPSDQPPQLPACAASMIGVVLFCLFGVCFVPVEREAQSPESIHPPQTINPNKTGIASNRRLRIVMGDCI